MQNNSFSEFLMLIVQLLYKESNSRVIYFIYVRLSNELSVQKFSKVLMDLDYLSQNVSISSLHNNQKSGNICIFRKYYYFSSRKYWPTFGGRSNLKLTHSPLNNQDPSKILKMFELKVYLKKCIYENYNSTVRIFK